MEKSRQIKALRLTVLFLLLFCSIIFCLLDTSRDGVLIIPSSFLFIASVLSYLHCSVVYKDRRNGNNKPIDNILLSAILGVTAFYVLFVLSFLYLTGNDFNLNSLIALILFLIHYFIQRILAKKQFGL